MPKQQAIGRYKILELIGQGSMGSVFKAHDPTLNRWVAIKTVNTHLRKSLKDTEEFKARFFREAQTSSQLNHPNIIAIYDMGTFDEEPFLVMEYLDGYSLEDLLRNREGLTRDHQFALLSQIASGLDYAHKQGYVHRDIKPANILVDQSGQIKIVDFGLARLQDSNITTSGMFLGTPSYASPEQIQPGEVHSGSDIFSFGIVAFETLFGKRPFPGQNISAILYQIVHTSPEFDFGSLEPGINDDALERAFGKVLAKTPRYRPDNCTALVEELVDIFQHNPNREIHWAPLFDEAANAEPPKRDSSMSKRGIHYDETIAMNDDPRSWYPNAVNRVPRPALYFLAAVLLLCVGWIGYSNLTPPPGEQALLENSAKPSLAMPPFASTEASPELTEDLIEKDRQNKLEKLGSQFLAEVIEGNMEKAETLLQSYAEAGGEPTKIEKMRRLITPDNGPSASEELERNNNLKAMLVGEFHEAKTSGRLDAMSEILAKYRKTFPQDQAAFLALENDFQATNNLRQEEIKTTRQELKTAVENLDPEVARMKLSKLSDLDDLTQADNRAYAKLNRNIFIDEFGIKFARIPSGQFIMGFRKTTGVQKDGADDLVQVTIPNDFFLTVHEITQDQFQQIMGEHDSKFIGEKLPASNITYDLALRFIENLNQKAGESVYRLPSSAEWEYACRAGGTGYYHFGSQLTVEHANSALNGLKRPLPVGSFKPNRWGLYDMHGNLAEWCEANGGSETYPDEDSGQPKQGIFGKSRPHLRGGAFDSDPLDCAAGFKKKRWLPIGYKSIGLRILRISRPSGIASAR